MITNTKYLPTPETEVLNTLVVKYIQAKEVSPFKDIQVSESGEEVSIDFDSEFEKEISEQFGDKLDVVLSDYIGGLISQAMEDLDKLEEGTETEAKETEETTEKDQ